MEWTRANNKVKCVVATSAIALLLLLTGTGCQQSGTVSQQRLIEHQALIDFSGLKPVDEIENVRVRAAVPRNWEVMPATGNALYTHQQWKSPTTKTGVGVAHIRMPLPINMGMLMWLAKREYTKKSNDGKILDEWTDDLGRPWFEAENDKYRVRGYVVVDGFQAWVIYFGHKVKMPPDPAELSLAARCAETIVPNLSGSSRSSKPVAETPEQTSSAAP